MAEIRSLARLCTACQYARPRLPCRAAFSTSAPSQANPTKKTGSRTNSAWKRGQKTTYQKVKTNVVVDRVGAARSRTALRKRIVLSNTNALEVSGLASLSSDQVSSSLPTGQMLSMPEPIIDRLRSLNAFQQMQHWSLFRQPCTLLRPETLDLAGAIKSRKPTRCILVGEQGSGKSIHMLQALSLAMSENWTIVHFASAQEMVTARTAYAPLPDQTPPMYIQPTFMAEILARVMNANPSLQDMQCTLEHKFPIKLPPQLKLAQLCQLGGDKQLAHPAFVAVMKELCAPGRPPLLLSMDNFGHAMLPTAYMSPAFKPIHAHSFFIIDWFLKHLRGEIALPNGGLVMAATSAADPAAPTLSARLQQLEELQQCQANTPWLLPERNAEKEVDTERRLRTVGQDANSDTYQGQDYGQEQPQPSRGPLIVKQKDLMVDELIEPFRRAVGQAANPIASLENYVQHDEHVLAALPFEPIRTKPAASEERHDAVQPGTSPEVVRLPGLSRDDTRGLLEYWARSGILRAEISERLVSEQWMLSGGGNIRELEQGCLRTHV